MGETKRYGILAVDDEKLNQMVLRQILSKDYDVVIAQSGQEALTCIEESRPDLILLDIVMPDMSGFDVLKKLKNSSLTSNIPVIVITGLANTDDEEKGFLLGAVDYITKPFKDTIVKVRVKTHIQILQQIRTIELMGLIDPLTEIPNRRSFNNRIEMEWRRAIREQTPMAFLMIDIDRFKTYNDTYGHPQGDTLLKEIARILASAVSRPADTVVRLGGEEFGVLLPDTSWEGGLLIAEKIRKTVKAARVPTIDGTLTSVTISIGMISAIPQNGEEPKEFIAKADAYLYAAKSSGRDKVFCE